MAQYRIVEHFNQAGRSLYYTLEIQHFLLWRKLTDCNGHKITFDHIDIVREELELLRDKGTTKVIEKGKL